MHLNKTIISILFVAIVTLNSCNPPHKKHHTGNTTVTYENMETGKLFPHVTIKNDTTLSYALYLPLSYDIQKENKIVFIFDAHGRGILPLKKYKTLADKYNLVLAASNDSKNGQQGQIRNHIITSFMSDVESRIHIDKNKMYTAGFSGGARIATLIALYNSTITGVIGCAAGFPQVQNPANRSFIWVGIVGNEDFNFLELKNLYKQLKANNRTSYLLVFDGKHEWPPLEIFDASIKLMLHKATNSKFQFQNNLTDEKLENREVEQQRMLVRAMEEKDINWWIKKIDQLMVQTHSDPSRDIRLMNKRLINYISMISYLFTDKALKSKNLRQAEKYLAIYTKVDPENPDMYFFRAERFALLKQNANVLASLQQAIDYGFNDKEQIKKSKAFNYLHDNSNFQKMLKELN